MIPSPAARTHGMRLADVAREIPGKVHVPSGAEEIVVTGVRHDSRAVEPGDLFVARKGGATDGSAFVAAAVARGAVAIVAKENAKLPPGLAIPVLVSNEPEVALAFASAAVYGQPSFALDIIGITGTNGKTTTAHLVRAALDGAAKMPVCGTVGTVGYGFGGVIEPATHTTPEADELTRVLARMRARGATSVAMEVSSHALAQKRVEAVRFRIAAFTNLSQDHLDYHHTLEEYAEAKARLFTELGPGTAIVNVDDEVGAKLAKRVKSPLLTVRRSPGKNADIVPISIDLTPAGVSMKVATPYGDLPMRSRLVGMHNVENLVVALAIAIAMDADPLAVAEALEHEAGAPGRLERCDTADDDVRVLVDYAHTPDALARALDSLVPFRAGRIVVVFGCGGDRDPTKRAPMGLAAGERADLVIVTSDNPRSEVPEAITAAVCEGVSAAGQPRIATSDLSQAARGFTEIVDRAEAISAAILGARAGDLVLLAGKGHEDYQIVGTTKRAFDDRLEAKRVLHERRARKKEG